MIRRLPPRDGEWIDRDASFSFLFEGEPVQAYGGDTITSALAASGRRTLARSFKYHRPRGILSLANHDANVLLETDTATNLRADVTAPEPGAHYRAVNTFGGLRHDAGRVLSLFAPVLPSGFYYKAFYRPRFLFPWWEKLIRHAAGLGRAKLDGITPRLPRRHVFCDLLVVGAGASGLAAARVAADAGANVVLVDEQARPGGSLNHLRAAEDSDGAWRRECLAALAEADNLTLVSGSYAAAFYADHCLPLVGADGITLVHARAVVLACGCYEQPAVFRNNDLPGVMQAGAAARLLRLYAVAPCTAGVLLAGTPGAYASALDLVEQGLALSAIVDIGSGAAAADRERARAAGVQVFEDAVPLEAIARGGELAGLRISAGSGRLHSTIDCDGLLMAVGQAPAAGLLVQAGGRLAWDGALGQHVPSALPPGVYAAGSLNGMQTFDARIADGAAAAAAALAACGITAPASAAPPRATGPLSHAHPIFPHARGKAFVDFDEDLTIDDLRTAVREGFDSAELMKRYSTIGMGPSQGKHANVNGLRILAELTGQEIGVVGATTPRPFVHPVPLAALAGRRLRRVWRTPLDAWHRAHGGVMHEAGTWQRPRCYGPGDHAAAVAREHAAVREQVALIDVSTLGKIEVFGADAEALLEYAYPCSFARLVDGMTRYVFMTDGGGTLIDDGVCARIAADHFYLTTTSSQAQNVLRLLELYAAELALDVALVERTFALGAINLAGPRSRAVLAALSDIDLAASAFPYLAWREGQVAGVDARVMRVGFVGELGYEIHMPASRTAAVWTALMAAGREHGIAPFGVDTQRLLRLEKGHVIVGHDTDGTTTPFEAGLGRAVAKSKPRHVGRHALAVLRERTRRTLAGFVTHHARAGEIADCLLVIEADRIAGRVTSVGTSPAVGAVIGLVMIEQELARPGRRIDIRLADGALVAAEIAPTPFYDADNARQALEEPGSAAATDATPGKAVVDEAESPVLGAYPQPAFSHVVCDGMRLARRAGARPEASSWLLDLAHLPARVVVGRGADAWLDAQGVTRPGTVQSACVQWGDGLVVRSHVDEYLLVAGSTGAPADSAARAAPGRHGEALVMTAERAHFALLGPAWEAILAELCAAPLGGAAPAWRAVRLAHCDVGLWCVAGAVPHWRVLASAADARYLFDVLAACLDEQGGALASAEELAALSGV